MSSDTSPWGSLKFTHQKEIRLQWEQLRIRIIKRGSDLLLVEKRDDSGAGIQLGADPESDFRRYAFQSPLEAVHVQPITPNRPLVVQPLHPLRLAPKAKVDFYISIPMDIQLSGGEAPQLHPLERLRAEILSDTWFGDLAGGVLCYAIKSRARRERPVINSEKSARALCKIQIHNQSLEQLHCTKFCLRLDRCHLWQNDQELWTSQVNIRYNGSDNLSAIDYEEKAPTEISGATKITEAPEAPLRGLIRRTFAGLGHSLT
ncbi:DUF432 domain-containing protein [Coraliomargarita sp. SDUM461004]|uniref:DUF432 domain-containing protein n=1 Tax=Thalassobacterium sedimentorum TaxID=3041258 RepID=A0ABU1AM27_9BACT|nr:DUF432 domain-containing protein [Coraliomargarita sp. SDUM461004]MDQ8194826.1 DUF432 domain-containing protein [Coraliomargarita sp. SDUM461004]